MLASLAPAARASTGTTSATAAQDFRAELEPIWRALDCAATSTTGGAGTGPAAALAAEAWEARCARLEGEVARYRKIYGRWARGFFAERQASTLPPRVLFPFGGGDLASALVAFPHANQITTLSSDPAGDPRAAGALTGPKARQALEELDRMSLALLAGLDPRRALSTAGPRLPRVLALSVLALHLNRLELRAVRYFRLSDDGRPLYLSPAELAAPARGARAPALRRAVALRRFPHLELVFARSSSAGVEEGVYRHLQTTASDHALAAERGLRPWLEGQGRLCALVKGGPFLLWQRSHDWLRGHLLDRLEYMVSDASGPPPSAVEAAGLVQETYGRFGGAAVPAGPALELRALFSHPSTRALLFRFGHTDRAGFYHLLLTRRPEQGRAHAERARDRRVPRLDLVDEEAGGRHFRLWTERGVVHVWHPAGWSGRRAGMVVYVHGYFVNGDQAWQEYRLPEQFAASGRDALFVVPEASAGDAEPPYWPQLEPLLRQVLALTRLPTPGGPLVLMGHSGAFRTLTGWLDHPRARHVSLLDGLYGASYKDFLAWLRAATPGAPRRLVLTSSETLDKARLLERKLGALEETLPVPLDSVPELPGGRPLVHYVSQFDHMGMVTSGQVIPQLLRAAALPELLAP